MNHSRWAAVAALLADAQATQREIRVIAGDEKIVRAATGDAFHHFARVVHKDRRLDERKVYTATALLGSIVTAEAAKG